MLPLPLSPNKTIDWITHPHGYLHQGSYVEDIVNEKRVSRTLLWWDNEFVKHLRIGIQYSFFSNSQVLLSNCPVQRPCGRNLVSFCQVYNPIVLFLPALFVVICVIPSTASHLSLVSRLYSGTLMLTSLPTSSLESTPPTAWLMKFKQRSVPMPRLCSWWWCFSSSSLWRSMRYSSTYASERPSKFPESSLLLWVYRHRFFYLCSDLKILFEFFLQTVVTITWSVIVSILLWRFNVSFW